MNPELDDTFIINVHTASKRVLEALLEDPDASVTVRRSVARELSRRKARFTGPVLVAFDFDASGREYAFASDIPLAIGDVAVVSTCKGSQRGRVVGHGTGAWNPKLHGPLRPVIQRLS